MFAAMKCGWTSSSRIKKDARSRISKPTDFEVFEDGVPQKVESFRFVTRETGPATSETKDDTSTGDYVRHRRQRLPKTLNATVTALVFDRLSPEARSLARKAGLAYAQEGMATGGFTGVFGIDQSLRTVQPFTDNTQLIKDAVERATGNCYLDICFGRAQRCARTPIEASRLDQQISSSAAAAAAAGAARTALVRPPQAQSAGQAAAQQKLLEMQNQMLDHYERLERDQEGFATINSLLAVISPMQNLPGRKTIIFFSEGLKLPPSVQQKFPVGDQRCQSRQCEHLFNRRRRLAYPKRNGGSRARTQFDCRRAAWRSKLVAMTEALAALTRDRSSAMKICCALILAVVWVRCRIKPAAF